MNSNARRTKIVALTAATVALFVYKLQQRRAVTFTFLMMIALMTSFLANTGSWIVSQDHKIQTVNEILYNTLELFVPFVIAEEFLGFVPAIILTIALVIARAKIGADEERDVLRGLDVLENHKKINGLTYAHSESSGAQAFVFFDRETQYICFLGSNSKIDFLNTNTRAQQVKVDLLISSCHDKAMTHLEHARVHQGFQDAYKSIRHKVQGMIRPASKTVFVGHSLGGALAVMAAMETCAHRPRVITFGCPRIGNAAFNRLLESTGVDVLHLRTAFDPVPKVPLYFPTTHGRDMVLDSTINPVEAHFLSEYRARYTHRNGLGIIQLVALCLAIAVWALAKSMYR